MVTLSWIVHTRHLLQEPQQLTTNPTEVTMPDQVQDTIIKTVTGKANPDHSLIFEDITAQAIAIYIEVALEHNTDIDAAIIEPAPDSVTPTTVDTVTDLTVTLLFDHIADHPNTEFFRLQISPS